MVGLSFSQEAEREHTKRGRTRGQHFSAEITPSNFSKSAVCCLSLSLLALGVGEATPTIDRASEVHAFAGTADNLSAEQISADLDDWYGKLQAVTSSVEEALRATGDAQLEGAGDVDAKLRALRVAANRAHGSLQGALARAVQSGAPQGAAQQQIEEQQRQVEAQTESVVERLLHHLGEVGGVPEQVAQMGSSVASEALGVAQGELWGAAASALPPAPRLGALGQARAAGGEARARGGLLALAPRSVALCALACNFLVIIAVALRRRALRGRLRAAAAVGPFQLAVERLSRCMALEPRGAASSELRVAMLDGEAAAGGGAA